ncbi:unnamed protein product [Acanthoscelides obtectus]|uniref:Uncharacterized protein n=1 Tax=Acanthoscelides obtectus TaxID=200917 RepID=A0A9P0JUD6_ACAOB|nr:unnamed protein product [Acanthoscelides obtectus]CAK1640764.1 hypothetical protein AOBTE_LOCUS11919 [Acanthoscelides obtectus]
MMKYFNPRTKERIQDDAHDALSVRLRGDGSSQTYYTNSNVISSVSSSFSLLSRRQGDRDDVQLKSRVDSFVVKTTCSESKKIDIQVARFVYATNCAFRAVEHPEFKRLMGMLRPGYQPPNRQQTGNELLSNVFTTLQVEIKMELGNESVCLLMVGAILEMIQ